jgi:hypothetical protein
MKFIKQTHARFEKERLKEQLKNRGATGKTTTKSGAGFKAQEQEFLQPGQALLALNMAQHPKATASPGAKKGEKPGPIAAEDVKNIKISMDLLS